MTMQAMTKLAISIEAITIFLWHSLKFWNIVGGSFGSSDIAWPP